MEETVAKDLFDAFSKHPKAKKAEVSDTDLLEAIKGLTQVLVERLPEPKVKTAEAEEDFLTASTVPMAEASDPVPFEFRQVVDEVLNKFFEIRVKNGAKISDNVDGFVLTIIVPDKYSTATEYQKQSVGGDLRVKAIPYALREIGVKEWCDLVWKTFNEDIQGQVTEDRLKDTI